MQLPVPLSRNWPRCERAQVPSTTTAVIWKIFSRPFPTSRFLTCLRLMKHSLHATLMDYGADLHLVALDIHRLETRSPISLARSFPSIPSVVASAQSWSSSIGAFASSSDAISSTPFPKACVEKNDG